jgi:hypothetical protein
MKTNHAGKNRALPVQSIVMGLLVLCFLSSAGRASWQLIYTNPKNDGNPFRACFFFNEFVGFIAGDLSDGVYKTTNGGQTWTVTAIPLYPGGVQPKGFITQILMTDPLHGWLTSEPPYYTPPTNPGLYRTTDGGASWNPVNVNQDFSDIYQTPSALVATSRYGTGGVISPDNGKTFQNMTGLTNGVDFVDTLNGVMTGFLQTVWSQTLDGGITWTPLYPTDNIETWSVYGVKGSNPGWFFTAGEGDQNLTPFKPFSSVRHATDYGTTWTTGTTLPFRTTGHIAGFGFTLYVQADTNQKVANSGLWRSKDSGKTWTLIGGPANDRDTRFAVTGCQGQVIYAFDTSGNVWKTSDGGDGSLPQYEFPQASLNVDSIDVCKPRDTVISVKNSGCDTIFLLDASAPAAPALDILDTNTGNPPVFPIVIPPGANSTLELELSSLVAGAYRTQVFLEIERNGIFLYDTVSVQSGLRFFNPIHALSNLKYDSTALCQSRDSTLIIANDSCFTVQLLSSQLKYGTNFALDTAFANDSIPAYSSKTFNVTFAPKIIGKIVDSLILNLQVLGEAVRLAYPITGIGSPDSAELVIKDRFGNPLPDTINFDTITRCQDSIFAFTISEIGCDSLFVTAVWLDSTKAKGSSPPASRFVARLPIINRLLAPDSILIEGIEALGQTLGYYQGYLQISDSVAGTSAEVRSLIPYRVFVKPGTRTLSLDTTPRNFDTITFCQQKDTIIPIVNLGCDTIHDSSISISGSNFVIVNPPKTPFVINPSDTFFLTVRYLPVNSGQAMGILTDSTDADSAPVRHIPLSGYTTPTDTVRFSAISNKQTVAPGDTATLYIMPGSKFTAKGLQSIEITLAYNGDIMTPFDTLAASSGMSGAPVVNVLPTQATGTKLQYLPITIDGTDMTFDSAMPILTMQFTITISDSAWTDFHIASFELNNGNNNFNKCLLGSTVDTGTIGLQFTCGDSILYKTLRYGSNWSLGEGIIPVSGIVHPNPVLEGSQISVPFTALRAVAVKIEIMDETGSVVYSDLSNVTESGAASYTIPGAAIRSGAYHYRLHPIDGGIGVATGSFVVIR